MRNLELIYSRHNSGGTALQLAPIVLPYNELTIVLKGELDYTVDGKKVPVGEGSLIYIEKGALRVRGVSDEGVDYVSFNFHSDASFDIPLLLKDAIHSETRLLIAAFDKISSRSYLENREKTEYILGCLLSTLEDRVKVENFNPITLTIMKYIHSNLGKRITLEDIGHVTFFSPIYCDTVFKRETGKSIIDYLLDKRMEEAKKLLLEGSLTLAEVAETVGFADYNYFSRTFKRRSGYTPSEYRRLVSEIN